MTYFLWILFAGAAMAQTVSTPPPPSAAKAAATAPIAGKPPAPSSIKDKAAATAPGGDTAAVTPPSADKAPAAAVAKPAETFQSAMEKQRAAIATQRAAVRQQRDLAVPWMLASPGIEATPGIEAADCAPVTDVELTPLIDSAAKQHQVEPKLLRGVIEQESGFRACAISPKGAQGLMQLMPATVEQFKVGDVFDPKQNIEAGATYLRQLLDKYKGDIKLALAAYNAGPGSVDKTGGIPDIKETQDYVEGIMKKMR